jgi:hypothetical protein
MQAWPSRGPFDGGGEHMDILHVHIPGGGFLNDRRQVGFLSASIFFKTSNEQLYLLVLRL